MKMRIIMATVTLLMLLAGMLSMTGCNTWHGAGKDVEKTGDAMQRQ